MSLFKSKKEKTTNACGCEVNCSTVEKQICNCKTNSQGINSIKVLGSSCVSCHALYENSKEAVKEIKLNVEVEYITNLQKVMAYGVMKLPALVINDKVVAMGKVLKVTDLISLFKQYC